MSRMSTGLACLAAAVVLVASCESERDEERHPPWPCSTYYEDRDGDGWGTDRTTCDWSVPEGYSTRVGDCCDTDPDVHPFADFKGVPHSCPIAQWDYDCNGIVTQDFPDTGSFIECGEYCLGSGWIGSVPACGELGTYKVCVTHGSAPPPGHSGWHQDPPNTEPLPGMPIVACDQYDNWSGPRGCR